MLPTPTLPIVIDGEVEVPPAPKPDEADTPAGGLDVACEPSLLMGNLVKTLSK